MYWSSRETLWCASRRSEFRSPAKSAGLPDGALPISEAPSNARGGPSVNWSLRGCPDRRASPTQCVTTTSNSAGPASCLQGARGTSAAPGLTPVELPSGGWCGSRVSSGLGGSPDRRTSHGRRGALAFGTVGTTGRRRGGRHDHGAAPGVLSTCRDATIVKQRRLAAYLGGPLRDDQSSSVLTGDAASTAHLARHIFMGAAGPRETWDGRSLRRSPRPVRATTPAAGLDAGSGQSVSPVRSALP